MELLKLFFRLRIPKMSVVAMKIKRSKVLHTGPNFIERVYRKYGLMAVIVMETKKNKSVLN